MDKKVKPNKKIKESIALALKKIKDVNPDTKNK